MHFKVYFQCAQLTSAGQSPYLHIIHTPVPETIIQLLTVPVDGQGGDAEVAQARDLALAPVRADSVASGGLQDASKRLQEGAGGGGKRQPTCVIT